MTFEVRKITAVGTEKRFMQIHFEDTEHYETKTIRISKEIYEFLKKKGVPTAQKLRYATKPQQNK